MITRKIYSDGDRSLFTTRPLTARCAQHLRSAKHACLGVSPFNSYFTEIQIQRLARWASQTFSAVHFFVPDAAAAYTLEALGYPPAKAAHKARRQGQYLINKICRALTGLGVRRPDELLLDSATLDGNGRYKQLLAEAEHRYRNDQAFAAHCLQASRWVLDKRLPPGTEPTEEQLRSAVRYFLVELPLFIDTAGIVGVDRSVFCYHQSGSFLHRLYRHELAWHPTPGQGFVVITGNGAHATDNGIRPIDRIPTGRTPPP